MHTDPQIRFGPFCLLKSQRQLLENGRPLRIGGRALDLLIALLERAGEVVDKNELLAFAWPTTVVEETSLRFHIANLRKLLGDGRDGVRYIVNVAGRGYCFVERVERSRGSDALASAAAPGARPAAAVERHNLPGRLARIVGREALIAGLAQRLPERRFLSIVGPGGMGKSTLALALAEHLLPGYAHGVWYVDVSVLSEAGLLPSTLSTAMGLGNGSQGAVRQLSDFLHDKELLVVLDNCERMVAAAAEFAELLVSCARGVHVVATSREALRAKGEWVQHLQSLELPPPSNDGVGMPSRPSAMLAVEALRYPAVQLFVERAIASLDSFELTDMDAFSVSEICRRLDGMPLAIELAAARIDSFGVRGLLVQLEDRFPLLSHGRRAVPDRHRTLRALHDWSYDMLQRQEQAVLRRLGVFNGAFTLDGAIDVTAQDIDPGEILDCVVSLVSKSLIAIESSDQGILYRLLDSTRAYALEKLLQADEMRATRLRQVGYLGNVVRKAEVDWAQMTQQEWVDIYAHFIDDMRGALDWCFASPDAAAHGARLVAAAIPFGYQLTLADEYRVRVEQALGNLAQVQPADPRLELRLVTSYAAMTITSRGPGPTQTQAWSRALELANELDDDRHRAEAFNGLFVQAYFVDGDYPAAIHLAGEVDRIAQSTGDPTLSPVVERLRAQSLHGVGRHAEARAIAEAFVKHPTPRQRLRPPYPIDRQVMMRMLLARTLWVQGLADQAARVSDELLELASTDVHYALTNAMAWTICPLALWRGDFDQARAHIPRMYEHSCRNSLHFGAAWAGVYDQALAALEGRPEELPPGLDEGMYLRGFGVVDELLGTIAPQFISDKLIVRAEAGTLGWCTPEILRGAGERLLANGPEQRARAEALFEQSLRLSREHRALSWELRAATSMARLRRSQGRETEGAALLRQTLTRFTEGFGTRDLREAAALLKSLAAAVPATRSTAAPAPVAR